MCDEKRDFKSKIIETVAPALRRRAMSERGDDLPCRPGCAACCIAPSISSPLPGLPAGKPAGVACPHLDTHGLCLLYGRSERPPVCSSFRPELEMCGTTREEALEYLTRLERSTAPR